MRPANILRLAILAAAGAALAHPALAQATNASDVSWAALDPGNDWSAQVIRSLFPIPGGTAGTSTGNEATAIAAIVGQFTGFIAAIACAFVSYNVLMNIHRAAETSRVLGSGQSWMSVVRIGFAGIMMFPIAGGFSAGQALVMQGAMVGVGMAKALYANALQAIGPDGLTIATPMVPGTQKTVAGLIDSELCMDLVNLAGNSQSMVPAPQAVASAKPAAAGGRPTASQLNGGYVTWRYALSTGNQSGSPVCGTVTLQTPPANEQQVAGVSVDMAAVQQAVLNDVVNGVVRPGVASVAQDLWQNKTAASLVPLQQVFNNAVNTYTTGLTAAATSTQSAMSSAIQSQITQARSGNMDLLAGEVQQSTLGWTAAGAYYLEIAKLNATTLSLLQATPVTTSPTYAGLGRSLSNDMAPLVGAARDFMNTLNISVQTSDGTAQPTGAPQTLADARSNPDGKSLLTSVFSSLNITGGLLSLITSYLMPSAQVWTDPFGGMMAMGQTLIMSSMVAMGLAAVLSSTTGATGTAIFSFLTGNWAGAAATVAVHAVMSFLGTPIFVGLTMIMIPGILIAYVLPMVPYVMWMAGVGGWIVLVCEAMIAVPLWMLAHMTVGGDGLHGRATEGWSLLFSVVFRPVLMVIGLFLGYFVFDCMSWLIRQTFGIAVGFVLNNGWIATNFVGLAVLLNIFVMLHVASAIAAFRMIAQLPNNLPKLIGFSSASRVDSEAFYEQAAMSSADQVGRETKGAIESGAGTFSGRLSAMQARRISGPAAVEEEGGGGMDSTLRATTDNTKGSEGSPEG